MTSDSRHRVKVLWLVKGFGPGGAERLLLSFARLADGQRFEVHAAYLLSWKDHLVAELEAEGVETHCVHGERMYDPRWMARLRRMIVAGGFDVVHNHSPLVAAQARLVCRTIPADRRPVLVSTEHNVWTSHRPPTRLANRATMALDDHVFAVSSQVRESMSSSHRPRAEVLVHGADIASISARRAEREASRAELGVPDGTYLVVTVANLRSQKDYPTMLDAARHLISRDIPVRFVSVGQGPLEDDLVAARDALGLGDRFQFLGYRQDPLRVLAAGDVFCLSSRYEGLPIALLEALAMGLPAVVTAVGGVPHVVRDGVEGMLVPAGDPVALAAALGELADESRRAELALGASKRSMDFDVGRAVERQQEVYSALTDSGRERW